MSIRPAILDDSAAISNLFCRHVQRWQRMTDGGQVEDVAYDNLSIYERWLHGGAWMSVETGAIWLNHLLRVEGIALVLTENDHIVAYSELFRSQEAAPYGDHLHIVELSAQSDAAKDQLLTHIIQTMPPNKRLTAACSAYDETTRTYYEQFGFTAIDTVQQVSMPAKGGSVSFYKVTEQPTVEIDRIRQWQMPFGRTSSARTVLEHIWTPLWASVPALTRRQTHRLRFNVAGQDAFVCIQEHLYNPRHAEVFCWTPKTPSKQLLGSIRDWAYKRGYRTLFLAINQQVESLFDAECETRPHQDVILARNLSN